MKERRCKVAECAFGLLEGVKGLSCYALVALVYTCDINHSLDHGKRLEFVLSVFISKFTANRRSTRVLSILLQSGIDFDTDEFKEVRAQLSKFSSSVKKQGLDIIVMLSFLTKKYSEKLVRVDLQSSFCHLIPKILATLSVLSDEQCSALVKLSICGDEQTRRNGQNTLKLFAPKYGNKLLRQLKYLVSNGSHNIHAGSVHICANHILDHLSKSTSYSDILKMLMCGYQKPCTSVKVSDILLDIDDEDEFAENLLDYTDPRYLTIPVLLTLLYLDHDFIEKISLHLSKKLSELTKDIAALTGDDWEQVNLPSGILYRNDAEEAKLNKARSAKKHLSVEEKWEEEIRRELSAKDTSKKNECLSAEGKNTLARQAIRRAEVGNILNQLCVVLS